MKDPYKARIKSEEWLLADNLKASEDEAIATMREFIEADVKAVNESAKATASVKVLDLLMDPGTHIGLMTKLEPLRNKAINSLRDVAVRGKVAAARANASAALLKVSRNSAPPCWPPEITVDWQERMEKASALCAV